MWHLYTAEGSQGPYTTAELRSWRASGQITDDWHVWREEFTDWKRVGDTPELLVNSSPAKSPAGTAAPPVPAVLSGSQPQITPDQPSNAANSLDAIFNRDKFLLRQKHLSISEKYDVTDEDGKVILYVERPRHLLRSILSLAAALAVFVFFTVVLMFLAVKLHLGPHQHRWVVWLIVVLAGLPTAWVLAKLLPKRHVKFFHQSYVALEVLEDAAFQFPIITYSVIDLKGQVLARFRKNMIVSIIRKSWDCHRPDGTYLCNAMEDSIILALLRRFIGPFFGLLRTNFVICKGDTEEIIGEFNRKMTLQDRYVLDMSADPTRTVDRRVAVALGVMLDTGERR